MKLFQAYVDKKDPNKGKMIRDVWSKGDLCFRSGDILVMDRLGWLYFQDRKGDTFRWKGENVSTTEVENIISGATGHADVVVYGVAVPGYEGRAGMMAVVGDMDLERLAEVVMERLPSYSRPVFVRIAQQIDSTGTYKLRKGRLQREGVKECQDDLYYLNTEKRAYQPLNGDVYDEIVNQEIRI